VNLEDTDFSYELISGVTYWWAHSWSDNKRKDLEYGSLGSAFKGYVLSEILPVLLLYALSWGTFSLSHASTALIFHLTSSPKQIVQHWV
jgi:hypothetical protein